MRAHNLPGCTSACCQPRRPVVPIVSRRGFAWKARWPYAWDRMHPSPCSPCLIDVSRRAASASLQLHCCRQCATCAPRQAATQASVRMLAGRGRLDVAPLMLPREQRLSVTGNFPRVCVFASGQGQAAHAGSLLVPVSASVLVQQAIVRLCAGSWSGALEGRRFGRRARGPCLLKGQANATVCSSFRNIRAATCENRRRLVDAGPGYRLGGNRGAPRARAALWVRVW